MSTIAIVTGASSGLGREFVRLIDGGAAGQVDEIWVIARRAEQLDALVRTCKTAVRPFCLDLTDPMSFDIIDAALAEEVDVTVRLLINNAGAGTFGSFALMREGRASEMANLLMRAPVELIYRTLSYMRSGSRIINVASVAAFIPQPKLALYSAAKRFILDLSRSLDAELGEVGIHVMALCPKFMRTEFLDKPGDALAAQRMTAIGFENVTDVAAAALRDARAGKSLCIPSLDMKALYAVAKVAPYRVALAVERLIGAI